MRSLSPAVVETLAHAWEALTGGSLWLVAPGGVSAGHPAPARLPARVRRSLDAQQSLDGERIGSRTWWVSAPLVGAAQAQLVAWSPRRGRWGLLLHAHAELLAELRTAVETSGDLTDQLIHAWDRLAFLYQLARIASGPSDLPEMLSAIVRLLAQVLAPEEAFLVLEKDSRASAITASGRPLKKAETLLECVRGAIRPLTLDEVRPALDGWAESGDLLLAPWEAGSTRGLVGLRCSAGIRFDADDLQLLASVAEQIAGLVESAEARAVQLERQRLEHELALASEFQRTLLPQALPQLPGLQVAAHLKPARRVGGDLYDALITPTGDLVLLLADVAGKGMPAALLTALVHAVFRGEAAHHPDPGDLLEAMNRSLFPDLDRTDTFVTAAALLLTPSGDRSAYASAGHLEVILCRTDPGSIEYLPATGPPLGVEPELSFACQPLRLDPADTLVVYSDGVTEAEGAGGMLFARQGLEDVVSASRAADAQAQLRTILEALDIHRGDRPLRDDVALVLVRAEGAAHGAAEVVPIVMPARISAVAKAMAQVREAARVRVRAGMQRLADDFSLAVSEIVTNQVQHAYTGQDGLILGRVCIRDSCLQADLFDRGIEFRPAAAADLPPDPLNPPDRGYGLRLARGLTDRCEYHRLHDGRNHWHLLKWLRGEEGP